MSLPLRVLVSWNEQRIIVSYQVSTSWQALLAGNELMDSAKHVLAGSDYVAQWGERYPERAIELIISGDLLRVYNAENFSLQLARLLKDVVDEATLHQQLRYFRQREMVRIIWRDLAGWANLAETVRNTPIMQTIAEWILSSGITSSSDMAVVGVFVTFYWTGAMIGRFIGSYLTKLVNPAKVLLIFALGAISLILISSFSTGLVAMWTLIAVGLFNSIMFPTIFSLALDGLGNDKPQGSGVLCTMIVGGAVIPPAFGFLTDSYGFNIAFLIVILSYGYIFFYAYKNKSRKVAIQ